MSALGIAAIVFVSVLGGGALGSLLGRKLPPDHLSPESKDIVKFGAGFIATMAALVLGLLVASAKNSYDAKATEIEQTAAKIILLDQSLRQYGPETKSVRDRLRAALIERSRLTWVTSESSAVAEGAAPSPTAGHADAIRAAVAALVPANDSQRALQARSLQILDDLLQTRWLFIAQSTEGISTPLLVVLATWLAAIALCTGLYAPRNATVAMVAVVCAVSVSGAIFLIAEMYEPFSGILKISDAPLRTAIGYLSN